jgi:tight adherence protein C
MSAIIALLTALAVIVAAVSLRNIRRTIREDDRTFLDPLPPLLRLIWPLVNLLVQQFGDYVPVEQVEQTRLKMRKAGMEYMMTPVQMIALRFVSALGFGLATLLCAWLLGDVNFLYVLLALLLGWVFPLMKINDLRKLREKKIIRALPMFLDFITMAVEAGMNLSGAFAQAVDKGPDGPLRVELQKVLRDVKAGMSRMDAIRAMAERLDVREIHSFASALAQAERTGASLGQTLRIQADQRRVERFQRAEKLALEAPVKLVFPLVAFIFPTTFIVLGFPIAMKFLYEV